MKKKSVLALFGVLTISQLAVGLVTSPALAAGKKPPAPAPMPMPSAPSVPTHTPAPVPPNDHVVGLDPVVRNEDGSAKEMSFDEAVRYCWTRGGLPRAKQLALAFDANSVSDTDGPNFRPILVRNEPTFYFNSRDYRRPLDAVQGELYWSSAVHVRFGALLFDGYYGRFAFEGPYADNYGLAAVRCVGTR